MQEEAGAAGSAHAPDLLLRPHGEGGGGRVHRPAGRGRALPAHSQTGASSGAWPHNPSYNDMHISVCFYTDGLRLDMSLTLRLYSTNKK
jgi:hypothetical protein